MLESLAIASQSYGIDNRFATTSESISQIPDIHAIQLLIPRHHFTHQRHTYTIKTISTGFLSRSCSPHHHQVHSITLTQHHHVPSKPLPSGQVSDDRPPRNLGLCRCRVLEVSVFHHTRLGMGVKMKRTIPCPCVEGRNALRLFLCPPYPTSSYQKTSKHGHQHTNLPTCPPLCAELGLGSFWTK